MCSFFSPAWFCFVFMIMLLYFKMIFLVLLLSLKVCVSSVRIYWYIITREGFTPNMQKLRIYRANLLIDCFLFVQTWTFFQFYENYVLKYVTWYWSSSFHSLDQRHFKNCSLNFISISSHTFKCEEISCMFYCVCSLDE